jgi:DNA repair protein RecO (recombination protein O)
MKDLIKKTGAIILRGIDYRETSKILTAFTEDFGKVQLIAKGIRDPKSRISAALQNLVHSEIVFYKKETQDIYLTKDATVVDFFEQIHGDLTRFAYASVVSDFLYTLLAAEELQRTLFGYSVFTLKTMDTATKADLPAVLVKYLLKGSSLIGFRMELDVCASCGKRKNGSLSFSHDQGGIICASCIDTDPTASEMDPVVHQFLREVQKQDLPNRTPLLQQSDYKRLFLLLSNWFYFHSNRTLKTLGNHIKGEPFEVYGFPRDKTTGGSA